MIPSTLISMLFSILSLIKYGSPRSVSFDTMGVSLLPPTHHLPRHLLEGHLSLSISNWQYHGTSSTMKGSTVLNSLYCITIDNRGGSINPTEESAKQLSYNDVKKMIEELGGRVSSTVHKRVDFVIASDIAVENATQRIRKAHKFDIPVLKVEYVEYCRDNNIQPVDIAPYMYNNINEVVQEQRKASMTKTGDHTKRKASQISEAISPQEASVPAEYIPPVLAPVGVVYECACICHDSGESSCSWCDASHQANGRAQGTDQCKEDDSSEKNPMKKKRGKQKSKSAKDRSPNE